MANSFFWGVLFMFLPVFEKPTSD